MKRTIFALVFSCIAAAGIALADEEPPRQLVVVSLDLRLVEFFENDELVFSFPARIGKPSTPTPIGEGHVYIRRDNPVFRYLDPGPNKGKIIRFAECGGGPKLIPKNTLRALGLDIRGARQYSIHSVICSETIGLAVSRGCVGLKAEDMLALFERIRVGAKVIIRNQ